MSLRLTTVESIRAPFEEGSEAIGWRRHEAGKQVADVLTHPTAGFLMFNPQVGAFQVSGHGEEILCAPSDELDWRWQRYLLGRVLPLAATLSGLEPWHASAVAMSGVAVAIMAGSAVGKTTIAAELMLSGGDLLADDVVAMRVGAQGSVAHPGPPLMSVRTQPHEAFSNAEIGRLGSVIAHEQGSIRLAVGRAEAPLPLRALYILSREAEAGTLEPFSAPDLLLGGTFVFAIRSDERLRKQLEVASLIARRATLVRVGVPRGTDLRAVARAIHRDFLARLEGE